MLGETRKKLRDHQFEDEVIKNVLIESLCISCTQSQRVSSRNRRIGHPQGQQIRHDHRPIVRFPAELFMALLQELGGAPHAAPVAAKEARAVGYGGWSSYGVLFSPAPGNSVLGCVMAGA
jgi:hypothetical protein